MSLGGVLGGSLVGFLGYFGVFLTFSILIFLTTFILLIFKEVKDNGKETLGKNGKSLTACQFMAERRPFLNLFCNGICNLILFVLEPTLALKLRVDYNYSSFIIGLYFFFFFGGGALTMTAMIIIPE